MSLISKPDGIVASPLGSAGGTHWGNSGEKCCLCHIGKAGRIPDLMYAFCHSDSARKRIRTHVITNNSARGELFRVLTRSTLWRANCLRNGNSGRRFVVVMPTSSMLGIGKPLRICEPTSGTSLATNMRLMTSCKKSSWASGTVRAASILSVGHCVAGSLELRADRRPNGAESKSQRPS